MEIYNKDIAVFEKLGTLPAKNIHAEAHVAVVCIEGKASTIIEGKHYNIEKNDIVICCPNQFIENMMISYDFKCRGLLMSPTYFQSIFTLGGKIWEAGFLIQKNPVIHLDDNEVKGFILNSNMIKYRLSLTHLPHYNQTIKLMLQSLAYEFYDILAPKLQLVKNLGTYSSGEVIFNRFLHLVSAESPCRHDVSFYADKLCITPKYLSCICKKQTGKTASYIINQSTINYIKQMLCSSDKSIKEISAKAGFDNLSFFGKYVKRELGVSPREYRQIIPEFPRKRKSGVNPSYRRFTPLHIIASKALRFAWRCCQISLLVQTLRQPDLSC